MEVSVKNQTETKILAEFFAEALKPNGAFVTLTGDIGAGKTAFCRYAIKALGVKSDVTSPSFVILNEYKSEFFPIYHFDLYRLEQTGVDTIKDELMEYSKEGILTFVEWADFDRGELPFDRIEINIKYDVDNYSEKRVFSFSAKNEYYAGIINKTVSKFNKEFKKK